MTKNEKKIDMEEIEQEQIDLIPEEIVDEIPNPLQIELDKANAELAKYKEIATNSQSQYVNLKFDFDSLQRRLERDKKEGPTKYLVQVMEKFLPFVEKMRISTLNIPQELQENEWVKGIQISYNDMLKRLLDMGIEPIESIGLEPNHDYHEPIGTMPTDDKKMKGKIIQEYEVGFVYKNGEDKTIIKPSKVIVGI
ncbi:MAG: nucleotide exchange factor GrpE [Candidatus Absconditabacteria bacterium]